MTNPLQQFLNDTAPAATAPAAAPAAPQPAPVPAAAPTTSVVPPGPALPPAPEEVLKYLRNPPPGVDVATQRRILATQYTLPPDLAESAVAPVPAPVPAQPVAAPAPVIDTTATPAAPPAPVPAGIRTPPKKKPSKTAKADRMKLACAALTGGQMTLEQAEAYIAGDK